jgi:hypothetical protein
MSLWLFSSIFNSFHCSHRFMQNSSYDQMIANSACLLLFALTEPWKKRQLYTLYSTYLYTVFFRYWLRQIERTKNNKEEVRNISRMLKPKSKSTTPLSCWIWLDDLCIYRVFVSLLWLVQALTNGLSKTQTKWFTNSQYRVAQIRISLLPPEL